jgi:hypothetical protein
MKGLKHYSWEEMYDLLGCIVPGSEKECEKEGI